MNKRLSAVNSSGAGVITALTVAAIWGQWRALGVVACIQVLVIGFNIWVNLVYLPRRGRSAEILRALVNLGTGVATSHFAGWPTPVWLWLPYVALAFDHLDERVATWTLVGICVVQDAAALADGVAWIYPVSFTALAVFCSAVSRFRFAAIRDMLSQSDRQRAELERAHARLREAHDQLTEVTRAREHAEQELRHAQKLEAVGRLAAGVAHEINTPVQFVTDSVEFLRDGANDLVGAIERLHRVQRSVLAGAPAVDAAMEATAYEESVELPYLLEHMPKAFARALDGTGRVASIVRSMKNFAHPDSEEMAPVDLNQAVESTLTIARSEYKHVAELATRFAELPLVRCYAGDVNQVLLNLIVNASHAIASRIRGTDERGRIEVTTRQDGNDVVVAVSDTGTGIPEAIREKIFDPFFTTKEIGRGTGQGLSIARTVIVEKHRGDLWFETEIGKGTTFFIRLPIDGTVRAISDRVFAA